MLRKSFRKVTGGGNKSSNGGSRDPSGSREAAAAVPNSNQLHPNGGGGSNIGKKQQLQQLPLLQQLSYSNVCHLGNGSCYTQLHLQHPSPCCGQGATTVCCNGVASHECHLQQEQHQPTQKRKFEQFEYSKKPSLLL